MQQIIAGLTANRDWQCFLPCQLVLCCWKMQFSLEFRSFAYLGTIDKLSFKVRIYMSTLESYNRGSEKITMLGFEPSFTALKPFILSTRPYSIFLIFMFTLTSKSITTFKQKDGNCKKQSLKSL